MGRALLKAVLGGILNSLKSTLFTKLGSCLLARNLSSPSHKKTVDSTHKSLTIHTQISALVNPNGDTVS